jgi:carboxylate-amine ligase
MMYGMELRTMRQAGQLSNGIPAWAEWARSEPYTVGIEEEVMLLHPEDWRLAHQGDRILASLPDELAARSAAETHQGTLELATLPHASAEDAADEVGRLRHSLADELEARGLATACAGTHPSAVWTDTEVSDRARSRLVYASMRELARREPTFALHVHVGVANADDALVLQNRLRMHLPLLLAVSANSPFWQGRDTGLASTRIPIFQAFPRTGVPRAFLSYGDYVDTVDQLLRCEAFPAPTFLWWDVRPQPRLGTVEVRIMDSQTTVAETAGLAALIQTIAHMELEERPVDPQRTLTDEALHENRFLAARDGMEARFIDSEWRVPARLALQQLIQAAREHAQELGCEEVLDQLAESAGGGGATRQIQLAERYGLDGLTARLSEAFRA